MYSLYFTPIPISLLDVINEKFHNNKVLVTKKRVFIIILQWNFNRLQRPNKKRMIVQVKSQYLYRLADEPRNSVWPADNSNGRGDILWSSVGTITSKSQMVVTSANKSMRKNNKNLQIAEKDHY